MQPGYQPRLGADQLAAFAAVIEHGSFDAAAALLHVTPSAISQRIKALEQRVGQVLVIREKPCRTTASGIPLLRLAAQTALLESEALAETGAAKAQRWNRMAVAVNADSMSTWFTAVFGRLPDVLFDVRIEDQDHSMRLLREGTVMGAVTTEGTAVPGCRADPIGVMRYVPVASPACAERFLGGFTPESVAAVPSLAWNRDDALQDMLIRNAFGRDIARPVHYVPTAEGYGAAVRAGLGWGMFPDTLAEQGIAVGDFARICSLHLDVPLYWQCWKLDSPTARRVTEAVRTSSASLRTHHRSTTTSSAG